MNYTITVTPESMTSAPIPISSFYPIRSMDNVTIVLPNAVGQNGYSNILIDVSIFASLKVSVANGATNPVILSLSNIDSGNVVYSIQNVAIDANCQVNFKGNNGNPSSSNGSGQNALNCTSSFINNGTVTFVGGNGIVSSVSSVNVNGGTGLNFTGSSFTNNGTLTSTGGNGGQSANGRNSTQLTPGFPSGDSNGGSGIFSNATIQNNGTLTSNGGNAGTTGQGGGAFFSTGGSGSQGGAKSGDANGGIGIVAAVSNVGKMTIKGGLAGATGGGGSSNNSNIPGSNSGTANGGTGLNGAIVGNTGSIFVNGGNGGASGGGPGGVTFGGGGAGSSGTVNGGIAVNGSVLNDGFIYATGGIGGSSGGGGQGANALPPINIPGNSGSANGGAAIMGDACVNNAVIYAVAGDGGYTGGGGGLPNTNGITITTGGQGTGGLAATNTTSNAGSGGSAVLINNQTQTGGGGAGGYSSLTPPPGFIAGGIYHVPGAAYSAGKSGNSGSTNGGNAIEANVTNSTNALFIIVAGNGGQSGNAISGATIGSANGGFGLGNGTTTFTLSNDGVISLAGGDSQNSIYSINTNGGVGLSSQISNTGAILSAGGRNTMTGVYNSNIVVVGSATNSGTVCACYGSGTVIGTIPGIVNTGSCNSTCSPTYVTGKRFNKIDLALTSLNGTKTVYPQLMILNQIVSIIVINIPVTTTKTAAIESSYLSFFGQ